MLNQKKPDFMCKTFGHVMELVLKLRDSVHRYKEEDQMNRPVNRRRPYLIRSTPVLSEGSDLSSDGG